MEEEATRVQVSTRNDLLRKITEHVAGDHILQRREPSLHMAMTKR
jgi:hypothetical protein